MEDVIMAINIVRKATTVFTMECRKCECIYTYNLTDLEKDDVIPCPECQELNAHSDRKPTKPLVVDVNL